MADASNALNKAAPSSASSSNTADSSIEHPLDPADSFFHIEDSSIPVTTSKSASKKKPTKALSTANLEDGWDFVEEIDDTPPPKEPAKLTKTLEKSKSKAGKDKSSSNSTSSSKTSRSASSMPPPSSHTSTRNEKLIVGHITGSPPDEITVRRNRQAAATNVTSKRPSAEMASTSGFKHRIYCSLYNLYHAQPSESPSLSSTPIFMMGAVFTPNGDSTSSSPTYSLNSSSGGAGFKESKGKSKSSDAKRASKEDFLEMCRTLPFFSYRKDFSRLEGYQVTSDVGWGCMLRTGQMLLAAALQRLYVPHLSGRQIYNNSYDRSKLRSPVGQEQITSSNTPLLARYYLDWFRDAPDLDKHPFSIHNLVRTSRIQNATANEHLAMTMESGVAPSWFSPTKLSRVLRFLVRMHAPEHLTMYVPPDGVLYVDEIVALCTDPQTSTLSPMAGNAHQDRTFLWWKRYSANGPSVSRSLTLPDYDGSEDDDLRVSQESNGSIDKENIENDALYQRALADSIAQYESEAGSVGGGGSSSCISSPSAGSVPSIPSPHSSRPISPHHPHHDRIPVIHTTSEANSISDLPNADTSLLEWSTKDWLMDSSSAPTARVTIRPPIETKPSSMAIPRSKPSELSTSGELQIGTEAWQQQGRRGSDADYDAANAQPSSVTENGKFFPRPSTESTGSIEASSTWVHLPIIRSDFGVIGGPGLEDPLDDYFVSPGMSSAPLNLSSWVENHEKLTGAAKATKSKKTPEKSTSEMLQLQVPPSNASPASFGSSTSISMNTATIASMASSEALSTPALNLDLSYASQPSTSVGTTQIQSPYSSIGTEQFRVLGGDSDGKSDPKSGPTSPGRTHILEDSVFSYAPPSAPAAIATGIPSSGVEAAVQARLGFSLNSAPNPTKNPTIIPSAPVDVWRPLLLLIPSRLGVSKVNPAYVEHLKISLSSASSVGIVGGKPNKSLYFFAFQDEHVFYLDPHYVHSTVKPLDSHGSIHDSYKVRFPQKMKFLDLDPSLALGFFLRTRADFEAFCQAHHSFAIQTQDDPSSEPIFTIQSSAPDYLKG